MISDGHDDADADAVAEDEHSFTVMEAELAEEPSVLSLSSHSILVVSSFNHFSPLHF